MNEIKKIDSILKKQIAELTKHGASDVEFYALQGFQTNLRMEQGIIKEAKSKAMNGIGVRVYIGKKLGFAATNSFDADKVATTAKKALKFAHVVPEDPTNVALPEPSTTYPKITVPFDKNIAENDVETMVEIFSTGKSVIDNYDFPVPPIVSGQLTMTFSERLIMNSCGIQQTDRGTLVDAYFSVVLKKSDTDVATGFDYAQAVTLNKFQVENPAKGSAKKALQLLGAKKVKTGTYTVIARYRSTRNSLRRILSLGANAMRIYHKEAFFQDKLEEKIATDKLNILDNPHDPDSPAVASFDDEGVATHKTWLIKEGILNSYFTDHKSASLLNLENTGNASRDGYSSLPYPSIHNIQIQPGTDGKLDHLIEDIKEGILIDSEFYGSFDRTPQFSTRIEEGWLIKNGEIVHPLKETMIAGNIFEVLFNIEAVSSDVLREFGTESPGLVIKSLNITSN